MNIDTAVIIPVYNEETVIAAVIKDLKKHFSTIICVDDGSTDTTLEVISTLDVIIVEHEQNKGQGAALRTGIAYALKNTKAKFFITFDADGQHRSIDAVNMLNRLKTRNLDVVLGSRFLGETENISLIKKLILKLAVFFTNQTTGTHLTDTHNGLRAFNRYFARNLKIRTNGMAHASEIIHHLSSGKFKYAEFPVVISYSEYSKSKGQSIFNSFNILKELYSSKK